MKVTVKQSGIVGKGGFLQFAAQYAFRLDNGLTTNTANMVIDSARWGDLGISDQFGRETTYSGSNSASPWQDRYSNSRYDSGTHKLLQETGGYRRAWLGKGAGGFRSTRDKKRVSFGVNIDTKPMAIAHQRSTNLVIYISPKARIYLGVTKGLWLRRSTRVVEIPARPVSLNDTIAERVLEKLQDYFTTGKVPVPT